MEFANRPFLERVARLKSDFQSFYLLPGELLPAELTEIHYWRPLRLFFIYRLLLSLLFLAFYFFSVDSGFLGSSAPVLFAITSPLYFILVLTSGLFIKWHLLDREQQAYAMLFIDIIAISLLMHASGGLVSGLGMLLAVSIAGGATMMKGRAALLFASMAALTILTEQIITQLIHPAAKAYYTQAGFLGAIFMAVALLAHVLSKRAKESEKLANSQAQELASMAQLNNYIIQIMRTGVLALDEKGAIRVMNETARELLNIPDASYGSTLQSNAPELIPLLEQWRKNPNMKPGRLKPVPGSPEVKPSFHHLGEKGISTTLIFLEDRSQITQQAQQMKLASLGRLTASIAHEIRNPLGAISHAGQLFAESPNLNKADHRLTEIILTNADRVNQVIENVLQLSRRERAKPEEIELETWFSRFLSDYLDFRSLEHDLITLQIEPEDCRVMFDSGQLRQIMTNLCDNALRYANQRDSFGIRILGGQPADAERPFIDVIDNGPGVSINIVRQLFEPFFTTDSQGTGLGLYIARELSEVNGATLEYLPIPAGGSCFRLGFALNLESSVDRL